MKKFLAALLLAALSVSLCYGDAADPGEPVFRIAQFENLADFEDRFDFYTMQVDWTKRTFIPLHGNRTVGGADDSWMEYVGSIGATFDEYDVVWLVAVPKSLSGEDVADLYKQGRVCVSPLGEFYSRDYEARQPYVETYTYVITGYTDERVFLDVRRKEVGDRSEEFFKPATPREYSESVLIAKMDETSFLEEGDFFRPEYRLYHVFDGIPDTGWAEGVRDAGIGEGFSVSLEKAVTVDRLVVSPGWFEQQYFKRNNRVESLRIRLGDKVLEHHFSDEMVEQEIVLDEPVTFKDAEFTILGIYETTDWNDTPISDIRFFHGDREIRLEAQLGWILMGAY